MGILHKLMHQLFGANLTDVEVATLLDKKAAENKNEKLNWRKSIVDLMKLAGLDPSLQNRRELAVELDYDGKPDGSEQMNVWLHKAVMRSIKEGGGKLPPDL